MCLMQSDWLIVLRLYLAVKGVQLSFERLGGVPHAGATECFQAISVNIARLDNKQMNENNAGSKAVWNKFNILEYRLTKMKKKTKFIISPLIISASILLIIITFSVNIDFDFARKTFSQ